MRPEASRNFGTLHASARRPRSVALLRAVCEEVALQANGQTYQIWQVTCPSLIGLAPGGGIPCVHVAVTERLLCVRSLIVNV